MNRENIKFNELLKDTKYDEIRNQMIHSFMEDTLATYLELTPNELAKKQPTWNIEDMFYGIDRLNKEIAIPFYRIYSEKEIEKNPILKDIGFIYLKATEKKKDYFVILLSGGAFGSCCNMVEAIPVAARFNELGVDAVVLTYETASLESFKNGLMPNPLDNIAKTLDYIKENKTIFNLDTKNYCIGGFSAGSYVVSTYGNKYNEYHQEKPISILLSYPLLSIPSIENEKMRNLFISGLYGPKQPLENEKNITYSIT